LAAQRFGAGQAQRTDDQDGERRGRVDLKKFHWQAAGEFSAR